MNRIRVLHFTRVINKNDFIDAIIRNADQSRFYIMASSYRGESNIESPEYSKEGIPFFKLNIDHGWIDMFRGAWKLRNILKQQKIEILHTHHFYESVIGCLACLSVKHCRLVIGRHYHNQFYLTTSGFKLNFYLTVERIIHYYASCIVVPSTAIVELLVKQGVVHKKIKMIPYGFDFSESRYHAIDGLEIEKIKSELGWNNKYIIGNISRHHLIKGQTYLIQAFAQIQAKIPESRLVLIGDGPNHKQLIEEASQLNLNKVVVFLGWRKDAHKLINCMDIIVHPTLQEAFPQIMIETMALGKPILITPVSGASDVIRHNENGFFIESKNPQSIVNTISKIYSNKLLLNSIAEKANTFVRMHYSKEKIVPRFEQLYRVLSS